MKKNKIGFACSCFDLLHAGHIIMLQEARKNCDYLIVGLQSDPTIDRQTKNSPILSMSVRYLQLAAVTYVDEIIPYQTEAELLELMKMLPIDVRFLGEEYKLTEFTGRQYCIESGIELFYTSRRHNLSTSNIRKTIFAKEAEKK